MPTKSTPKKKASNATRTADVQSAEELLEAPKHPNPYHRSRATKGMFDRWDALDTYQRATAVFQHMTGQLPTSQHHLDRFIEAHTPQAGGPPGPLYI